MRKKSSARASDVARQAGNAACAVWTAASISSTRGEVDRAGLLAGRRVVDRAGAPGRRRRRGGRRSSAGSA